jgi:glycosyltransferase involved in cell wall biosynthesis
VRINIVIGPFYPIPPVLGGAVEKVHLLLAGAYRDAGHQVAIVSRRYKDFPAEEIVDGIRHVRVRSRDRGKRLAANLIFDLLYALRVARALPPADLTITNAFFLPLLLPRRRAGKLYVQVGRRPKGQMFLYFRADRLQAVSRAVADAILRQAPWLGGKVVVTGYAIPEAYFAAGAECKREKRVLYVGRIAREKGIELLLRAFARLPLQLSGRSAEDWRLRVIGPHAVTQGGDGPEYLEQLKTLARQLNVACDFIGPIFDQTTLIGEYRRAAIFVYPSLAEAGESFGLAPLEAMAAGCAVIVSDLQCFDDYISHGMTGRKFDHRGSDPAVNLAEQLALLVADPALLQKIAGAGRGAADNFRAAAIAGRMLDDFQVLVGAKQRP